MKTKSILLSVLLLFPFGVFAQGAWTQKASYPLAGRQYANGFSIGNLGYYAFGRGSGFSNSVNVVEYNPLTNAWTQKSNFPGSTRIMSHVFVIDTLAYFVSGAYWYGTADDYSGYNDMWVYNRYNDSWTQLNNFPGTVRHSGFAFSFEGKGYFGLGIDNSLNFLDDIWQYDPVADTWTQKANFPGVHRKSGFQFSVGKNCYIGLGYDNTFTALSDVWRYDVNADTWTQLNNFPGVPRCWLSCISVNNKGYIVTGYLLNSSAATKQFWQYEPGTDTWSAMPDFSGIARYTGSGFAINGKIYNGLGYSAGYLNDFWVFEPNVGIEQQVSSDKSMFKTYPNPAVDRFTVEVSKLSAKTNELAIMDISGRVVMTLKIDGNPQLISVDCSSWTQGKYFLVLRSGMEKWVNSVTIQ